MKTLSFKAPDGFEAPEDSAPGKPFDVLATVVMGGDGNLTLQAVDGVEVTVSSGESPEMEADEEEDFMSAVENKMSEANA